MTENNENMAVATMRKNGGVSAGIDVAVKPLRTLIGKLEKRGKLDEKEVVLVVLLERVLDNLDAIGAEVRDAEERRFKRFADAIEREVRKIAPGKSEDVVKRVVLDVLGLTR